MWCIIYPRQGDDWYHIDNLLDAGEIYQYALNNFGTKHIVVQSICGTDFRRWVLNTQQKVETLYWYLKNNVNTNSLKVRVKEKAP